MIRTSALRRMLLLECAADDWFDQLSDHEQRRYLEAHPESHYAQRARVKKQRPSGAGPLGPRDQVIGHFSNDPRSRVHLSVRRGPGGRQVRSAHVRGPDGRPTLLARDIPHDWDHQRIRDHLEKHCAHLLGLSGGVTWINKEKSR